jgi:hypothetical protein
MTSQKTVILESKTQAFIDALSAQGGKPIYQLSYDDARQVLEDAQDAAQSGDCRLKSKTESYGLVQQARSRFESTAQGLQRKSASRHVLSRRWLGIGQQKYA